MAPPRTTRLFLLLAILASAPAPAAAQVIAGHSLKGDWVRIDSNNDPADLMRIVIDGDAKLTSLPASVPRAWQVGQVLWQGIQANGSLQVRGSDGQYYPATMTLTGPDEIQLTVHYRSRTAGDIQTWRRSGPDLSGDWVQVAPVNSPSDGTRIQATLIDASIRYLPASAPRAFRVSSRLWQNIGASGTIDVLGSDRRYHSATYTLLAPDRVQIDGPQVAGGRGQIWVRPGAVASAKATLASGGTLAPPPTNPNTPGANLQLPGNQPGSGVPGPTGTPTGPFGACMATALREDGMGVSWGFGLSSPSNNPAQVETLGLGPYLMSGFSGTFRGQNELTDWEPARLPAFALGEAYVWQPRTRAWTERHDLTASEFDQENQSQRAAGHRLSDFEAYLTSSGMRYAGVWVDNSEGVTWWFDYDMDATQYGSTRQNLMNNGLRLVDIEGYETPNGIRWAAVWYQSCDNTTWDEVRATDATSYQQQVTAFAAQGFQVVDFETYQTASGQGYAAIVEAVPPTRTWAAHQDRTLKWFLNLHRRYEDEGLRLIDFESYDTSLGVRYAGVWAENDVRHDFAIAPVLDDSIQAYQTMHGITGVSVVIIQDGETIYRRGFGWADGANEKTADSGTIYLTASVAKAIGGTLVAKIHEENPTLNLPRRRTSDFITLPSDHTHTIEQLLAKTGCVRHYSIRIGGMWVTEGPTPLEEYYQWRDSAVARLQAPLVTFPPNWPPPGGPVTVTCTPGLFHRYSTHGFTFVGAVLEKVLQEDIHTIIWERITRPYGLTSMRTVAPLVSIGGIGGTFVPRYYMAQGYVNRGAVNYEDSSWKVLGGGLQTHARDLARFGWLVLNGDIVSPTTRDNELWRSRTGGATQWPSTTAAPPEVGLAWVLRDVVAGPFTTTAAPQSGLTPSPVPAVVQPPTGRRVAQHGGIADGARSQLTIFRDDGLVIAVLTNERNSATDGNGHPIQGLADQIGRIVLRDPPP